MYGGGLLMMGRDDARSMWSFVTELNWNSWCTWLVI